MSRLNIETPKTLDELIPQYAANKMELDSYKKICEEENTAIKTLMTEQDISKYSAGGYIATKTVSTRETVDEEKLLEVIKKHNVPNVVKTKEYVDMKALEDYLYKEGLSQEFAADFSNCRNQTEVVSLRIKKEK